MDELLKQAIEKIPRKIIGGLSAMWVLGYFAEKNVDWKILAMMSALGIAAIGSHWFLEWKKPTEEKKDE